MIGKTTRTNPCRKKMLLVKTLLLFTIFTLAVAGSTKSNKVMKGIKKTPPVTITAVSTVATTTVVPFLGPSKNNVPGRNDPYFEITPYNVTAILGKNAYLTCSVKNLGNKTVSWIRHKDLHILAVGGYIYTSDLRHHATHHPGSDEWSLQIDWTQERDAGIYECQINTRPVRSYFIMLRLCEDLPADEPQINSAPETKILGGPDIYVDKGSTINLTCVVQFVVQAPVYVFWYHQEEIISFDSNRGGVNIITEKGTDQTVSYLLIQNADKRDSGKYSCCPSNSAVSNVMVHVLNGEIPAAMHTNNARNVYFNYFNIMVMVAFGKIRMMMGRL